MNAMPWKGYTLFTDFNSGLWSAELEPKQPMVPEALRSTGAPRYRRSANVNGSCTSVRTFRPPTSPGLNW